MIPFGEIAGVAIGIFFAVLFMRSMSLRVAGRRLGEWVALLVVLLVGSALLFY